MLTARKPFIEAHRAALVDYPGGFAAHHVRWFLDPQESRCRSSQIAARVTKQPADRFDWVFTKSDYYRDPDLLPHLDALQRNVDMTKELGFVNASFDVRTHSDLSLISKRRRSD
jgi:sulfonate transport system substrate-binding protein